MYKQNASLQNPTKGESGRFDHQRFVSVAEAERLVKSGCASSRLHQVPLKAPVRSR
jgi:hypothetical protein